MSPYISPWVIVAFAILILALLLVTLLITRAKKRDAETECKRLADLLTAEQQSAADARREMEESKEHFENMADSAPVMISDFRS